MIKDDEVLECKASTELVRKIKSVTIADDVSNTTIDEASTMIDENSGEEFVVIDRKISKLVSSITVVNDGKNGIVLEGSVRETTSVIMIL